MVAWYWLIVCVFVSFWFGYFTCVLLVISKQSDERTEKIYLKETGKWSHNEPWFRPDEMPDLKKDKKGK